MQLSRPCCVRAPSALLAPLPFPAGFQFVAFVPDSGAKPRVHRPPSLQRRLKNGWTGVTCALAAAAVAMSFGGEYLFPEKWKIINDTPDDGQLSKTEKIRRGEVEFHRKTYVDDDWKYHHGRMRQVRSQNAAGEDAWPRRHKRRAFASRSSSH